MAGVKRELVVEEVECLMAYLTLCWGELVAMNHGIPEWFSKDEVEGIKRVTGICSNADAWEYCGLLDEVRESEEVCRLRGRRVH